MSFRPHVSAESKQPEFTLRAIILGIFLGLLFGIANAYLALKVGMTVSASIPAAVISMAIFRLFFKRVSILENNLVQTIASVGEGLAAGIVFTLPALFILGEHPSPARIFLLASLGGILGILFMIPMRRYIIVKEHKVLPFPEGTAAAEILKSGESSTSKALMTLVGIVVGAFYKVCSSGLYLWDEILSWTIKSFENVELSVDTTPALFGVGSIIGPRIASILFAGGALSWWVLIPLIRLFGQGDVTIYPSEVSLSTMSSDEIWSEYIRYIGAGCVAMGGIFSLFKIGPILKKSLHIGVKELFHFESGKESSSRTDRDISLRWLILGTVAIILFLWLFPGFSMNVVTILLLIILGFCFVAVISFTVGIVGSSSSPSSGMTITTLLITCLIFISLGWTERVYLIAALTMSVVTNVAIALGATTSQDLKTGHLLGATPRFQQIGEIIGIFLPALAIGGTLCLLAETYRFGSPQLPAPQGTMMAMIATGVIEQQLPVALFVIGVIVGIVVWILRLPILPFAIGLYLPLSLSTAIMFGGFVSLCLDHFSKRKSVKEASILTASGLIAGNACMGVLIALLVTAGLLPATGKGLAPSWVNLLIYLALGAGFYGFVSRTPSKKA
jgi:putative OPT family oligopeptide transporter